MNGSSWLPIDTCFLCSSAGGSEAVVRGPNKRQIATRLLPTKLERIDETRSLVFERGHCYDVAICQVS